METSKVTTDVLRKMATGEQRTFSLADANAIYTAKALAYRVANIERCRFSTTSDFANNTITITRLPYDTDKRTDQ